MIKKVITRQQTLTTQPQQEQTSHSLDRVGKARTADGQWVSIYVDSTGTVRPVEVTS